MLVAYGIYVSMDLVLQRAAIKEFWHFFDSTCFRAAWVISPNIANNSKRNDRKDQRSFNSLIYRHKKAGPCGKPAFLSNA